MLRIIGTAVGAGIGISSIVKAGTSAYKAVATAYGDDVARAIAEHGDDAVKIAQEFGEETAEKCLGLVDDAVEAAGNSKIPWDSWQNYEKVFENEQQYAKVGDRLYSKHAVERMQPSGKRYTVGDAIKQAGGVEGRSVSPQFVENVINTVKPTIQANGNLSYVSGTVEVITNQHGYVVTIITK